MALPGTVAERLASVQAGIADAALLSGRDPASITLIVVTKYQSAALIRELAALGVADFGESRHQEAQSKAAELRDLGLRWHFIGQLQSKKARQVRGYAQVIHSVDRDALIDALTLPVAAAVARPTDCFIQVNLTEDDRRAGTRDQEV